MTINLPRGQFLRVVGGAGSMKRLLLGLSFAATTLAGCAQFGDWAAPAGATGVEEQSPYPTRFRNDNRHPA